MASTAKGNTAENRLMIEWLIGTRSSDIRYYLAELLHSDEVKANFSRIIIDAPPRLTTGTIQALCASTHVLIPTKMDVLSAEAVGTFIAQIQYHEEIMPSLKYSGVVGTMLSGTNVPSQANSALNIALEHRGNPTHLLPQDTFIPQTTRLGWATGAPEGQRIMYASPSKAKDVEDIRSIFNKLRDNI